MGSIPTRATGFISTRQSLERPAVKTNISRRKMLLQILRVVTSKLIKGEYHFSTVSEVSSEYLHERIQSGQEIYIVDTRSTDEFTGGFGHIPNSHHVPMMDLAASFANLDDFKRKVKTLESQFSKSLPFTDREVVTICPGGGFSLVAAEIMAEAGFSNVKSLSGGIDGWFKKGYPTSNSS